VVAALALCAGLPWLVRARLPGMALVGAAGPAMNFAIALVCLALYRHGGFAGETLDVLKYAYIVNVVLGLFNLIPVPPLDGSHLLYHALPPRAGSWYRGLQRFGYLPIFALMFLFRPVIGFLLTPAFKGMSFLLRLILPFSVGDGWNIFQS
jgi:Zn-dependent protease